MPGDDEGAKRPGDPSGLRTKRACRKMSRCPETGREHVPADLSADIDATEYRCHWCRQEVTLRG